MVVGRTSSTRGSRPTSTSSCSRASSSRSASCRSRSCSRRSPRTPSRRSHPFGGRTISIAFVLGLTLPIELVVVALYFDLAQVGLTNSYLGVILAEAALFMPFGVYWMQTHFVVDPHRAASRRPGSTARRSCDDPRPGAPADLLAGDHDARRAVLHVVVEPVPARHRAHAGPEPAHRAGGPRLLRRASTRRTSRCCRRRASS